MRPSPNNKRAGSTGIWVDGRPWEISYGSQPVVFDRTRGLGSFPGVALINPVHTWSPDHVLDGFVILRNAVKIAGIALDQFVEPRQQGMDAFDLLNTASDAVTIHGRE